MIAITKIAPIRIRTIVVDRLLFFVLWRVVFFLGTRLKRLMINYFIECNVYEN
jgi:hypothetical protein